MGPNIVASNVVSKGNTLSCASTVLGCSACVGAEGKCTYVDVVGYNIWGIGSEGDHHQAESNLIVHLQIFIRVTNIIMI